MIGIYKFFYNHEKYGLLEGIFTEHSDNVEKILGKHVIFDGEFCQFNKLIVEIDIGTITLISNDRDIVAIFERYNMNTGFNPFLFLPENDYNLNIEGC